MKNVCKITFKEYTVHIISNIQLNERKVSIRNYIIIFFNYDQWCLFVTKIICVRQQKFMYLDNEILKTLLTTKAK